MDDSPITQIPIFINLGQANEVRANRNAFEELLSSSTTKILSIEARGLTMELQQRIHEFNEIIDSIDTSGSNFELDSVQVSFSISAEGKIGLQAIGQISNTPSSSITVTLKRRKKENE